MNKAVKVIFVNKGLLPCRPFHFALVSVDRRAYAAST